MNKRYKIAIGHPFMARGGSESKAMWLIDALHEDYDVTLITTGGVNLEELNIQYGTNLSLGDFNLIYAPVPFFIKRYEKYKGYLYIYYRRYCKSIGSKFDLAINTYNLVDWGKTGVQILGDFSWCGKITRKLESDSFFNYRKYLDIKAWIFWVFINSRNQNKLNVRNIVNRDIIIANSKWTKDLMYKCFNMHVPVIYPPVWMKTQNRDWQEKENGFVCIGRISPEKKIETIIEVLTKVRQLGLKVHLHIIGGLGSDNYSNQIRKKCNGKEDWIFLEGQKGGREKEDLLNNHRYSIHACTREAFGISVAEFVKSGTIPFIPDKGGQTEIVPLTQLQYSSIDDAVEKIISVLKNKDKQNELVSLLKDHGRLFDIKLFKSQYLSLVKNTLGQNI